MTKYEMTIDIPAIHKIIRFHESDIESARTRLKDTTDDLIDTHLVCAVYEVSHD